MLFWSRMDLKSDTLTEFGSKSGSIQSGGGTGLV